MYAGGGEPLYPPQDNIPADTTARVADTWLSFMSSPPFQRWCPRGRNGGSDCSMPRRGNNLIRPSVEKGLDLEHRKRSQDRVAGVDVDRMAYEEDALAMLDSIYRLALWLTPREADARDLVQETYLRALEARATFRPGASMRAWLA